MTISYHKIKFDSVMGIFVCVENVFNIIFFFESECVFLQVNTNECAITSNCDWTDAASRLTGAKHLY